MRNQFWIYLFSALVSVGLSYLINQLPGVSDSIKPWLWIPVMGLVLVSVWLGLRNAGSARSQRVLTDVKARNIRVKGITVEDASNSADQFVASGLEASEDIDLGDISVK